MQNLSSDRVAGKTPPGKYEQAPARIHFCISKFLHNYVKTLKQSIRLDKAGNPNSRFFGVFDYIGLCEKHYEKVGVGADYIEGLIR